MKIAECGFSTSCERGPKTKKKIGKASQLFYLLALSIFILALPIFLRSVNGVLSLVIFKVRLTIVHVSYAC